MSFYNLILSFTFLINPVFSFFLSFIGFIFKKKEVFILSISISLIFAYQPLMYDASSIYFGMEYYGADNFYISVISFLKKYTLFDYYFVVFIFLVIIFYIWFRVAISLRQKVDEKKDFLYVLAVFFLIIYRDIMDLNRFYLSLSLSLYCFYYLMDRYPNKKAILFALIGIICIAIHKFVFVIYFLYIISVLINSRKFYLFFLILSIIMGCFSHSFLNILGSVLNVVGVHIPSAYVGEGGWGENEYFGTTLLRKILEFLIAFSIAIYALKLKKNSMDEKLNFLILIASLFMLCISYKTLAERTIIITCVFSIYLFTKQKNSIYILIITLLLFLRFFSINFLKYGYVFSSEFNEILYDPVSKVELQIKPFYYPTILLLDFKNGYSDEYIEENAIWGRKDL